MSKLKPTEGAWIVEPDDMPVDEEQEKEDAEDLADLEDAEAKYEARGVNGLVRYEDIAKGTEGEIMKVLAEIREGLSIEPGLLKKLGVTRCAKESEE